MLTKLEQVQRDVAIQCFGSNAYDLVAAGLCIKCKAPALENCYSPQGIAEVSISGMCEICFDKLFNDTDDEKGD